MASSRKTKYFTFEVFELRKYAVGGYGYDLQAAAKDAGRRFRDGLCAPDSRSIISASHTDVVQAGFVAEATPKEE